MIRIRKVAKTSRAGALNGIDLDVEPGGSLLLAGTDGSGRSTLLAVLATLVRPTAGRVEIGGIDALESPQQVRRRIGYLGPSDDLHPRLSVGEHLDFMASSRGLRGAEKARATAAARDAARLAAERPIATLAPGQRRQLALAAALLGAPPLLLLDRPSSGIDPLARRRFAEMLVERHLRGATLVVACDVFDLPAPLRRRVAFLHRGRLLADRVLEAAEDPVDVLAALDAEEGPAVVGAAAAGTGPWPAAC